MGLHSAEIQASRARARRKSAPETLDPLQTVLQSLDDDKAEEITTIDLRGKSSLCDWMVIATGRSSRQVVAMAEHLEAKLKPLASRRPGVEGLPHGDWVLIDGGDVIVHLFRPEVRSFYGLEKMWSEELAAEAAAS